MSVPVSRRGTSSMEFYNTAVDLRVALSKWLLRDFGIKKKIRRADIVAKSCQMLPPDREAFLDILKRYNLTDQLAVDYPNWWIMERRVTIDRLCAQMLQSIRSANAIYPTSEQEYWERRLQQNKAIGAVEALSEELQFVIAMMYQTLGVDVEKYMPFAELLEKELNLLKGWRKSDNRILRQIKNGKTKKGEGDDAPSANPKNF